MAAFVDCVNLSLFISESPNFVVFNGALYDKLFTTLYAFPSKYYYTDLVPTVKFVASSRGFSGCSFTEFTLKNRLEGVDMFLFRSCFNLKKIDLRCGVFKTLSYSAFTGCYNLFELKLPKTIEEFSYLLFTMTGKLKSLTLPDNLKKIHTRAFESSSLTDINYCGLFNVPYKIPSSYNVHVTQFYQGGSLFAGKTISDRNFVCEAIYCTHSYVMLPVIKTIPHNIRCYQFSFNLILLSQVFISI
ncbi:hypothetical protein TVAG_226110 [Trichomonas vaginalis G3]|uniref:Surface antigen BspA-like n=1 Tax=Trichomonas vaginalis (strain ATCC PRA-98 / G3) TaxID=412133 RepID=A2FSL0_TRIV3|nr:ribonuclease inhibitor domain-containing protein [Trichomonas vaginalis G3]EAX92111.1 hypothetical protein TVAG_226110 [Trichomonas vaginalis G3]KAI5548637.1 ribonuclease inhibitor domain-containing protein [Trichomonas vaginalis G3]|eukprot:XP_001305041.1 hypothetical protein [Trichomonas vaginalis G3]